jgi:threonine/homoserine/homoserine lactone efflux protein
VAFEVLKVLGVLYLVWMAWSTVREHGGLTVSEGDRAPRPASRIVLSGVLVNLLNPKLTIFAFAFLPQFAGSRPGSLTRMLGLSGVFMAVTSSSSPSTGCARRRCATAWCRGRA